MRRRSLLAITALCAAVLTAPAAPASADSGYVPPVSFALATVDAGASNQYYDYGWASNTPSLSMRGDFAYREWTYSPANASFRDDDGNLLVLTADVVTHRLAETTYDGDTLAVLSHHSVAFDTANGWSVTGLHYDPAGDHIYALQTRDNPAEDPDLVAVRVTKHDRSLGVLGTAPVEAGDVALGLYHGWDAGSPSMTMAGKWLVVHTSREMFQQGGDHHESNVTYLVDTDTMTAAQTGVAANGFGGNYVSHSFNQFATSRGDDAIFVDHGDGAPRAVQLAVAPGYFAGPTTYDAGDIETHSLLAISGAVGANYTGVTVNGVAAGGDRVLVTGVAEPQTAPMQEAGNLYLISADIDTGASTFQWLTTGSTSWVGQPTLTPLGDGTFALLYPVNSPNHASVSLHYRHLDENGQTLTEKVWTDRELAATSTPVRVGDRLYWVGAGCGSTCSGAYVFGLDVSDPTAPVALGRVVTPPGGDPGGPGNGGGDELAYPDHAKVGKPTGKAKVGGKLTASTSGYPSGTVFRYQWKLGGKAVVGATKKTFKIKKTVKYKKHGKIKKLTTKGKQVRVYVTSYCRGYVTITLVSPGVKVK